MFVQITLAEPIFFPFRDVRRHSGQQKCYDNINVFMGIMPMSVIYVGESLSQEHDEDSL